MMDSPGATAVIAESEVALAPLSAWWLSVSTQPVRFRVLPPTLVSSTYSWSAPVVYLYVNSVIFSREGVEAESTAAAAGEASATPVSPLEITAIAAMSAGKARR